jgi:ubiquinone/menaquinone biosynthesis C-methylase UbiE
MTLKALHHDTVQRAEVVQIILHEIILQLLKGQLHKAPIISPPQRILDVGTCIGIWAIDMADKRYPSAEVLGIDLR